MNFGVNSKLGSKDDKIMGTVYFLYNLISIVFYRAREVMFIPIIDHYIINYLVDVGRLPDRIQYRTGRENFTLHV